jgi:hypothetical protein
MRTLGLTGWNAMLGPAADSPQACMYIDERYEHKLVSGADTCKCIGGGVESFDGLRTRESIAPEFHWSELGFDIRRLRAGVVDNNIQTFDAIFVILPYFIHLYVLDCVMV